MYSHYRQNAYPRFTVLPMFNLKKFTVIFSVAAIAIGSIPLVSDNALARGGGRSSGYSSGRSSSYSSGRSSSGSGGGRVNVRGYTRKNGTYVPAYTRAAPGRGIYTTSGGNSFLNPSNSNSSLNPSNSNSSLNPSVGAFEFNSTSLNKSSYPYPGNLAGLKLHENDKEAYVSPNGDYGMGLAYNAQGNVDLYQMYMDWGTKSVQQQQYKTALNWFNKALAIRPSSSETMQAIQSTKSLLVGNRR